MKYKDKIFGYPSIQRELEPSIQSLIQQNNNNQENFIDQTNYVFNKSKNLSLTQTLKFNKEVEYDQWKTEYQDNFRKILIDNDHGIQELSNNEIFAAILQKVLKDLKDNKVSEDERDFLKQFIRQFNIAHEEERKLSKQNTTDLAQTEMFSDKLKKQQLGAYKQMSLQEQQKQVLEKLKNQAQNKAKLGNVYRKQQLATENQLQEKLPANNKQKYKMYFQSNQVQGLFKDYNQQDDILEKSEKIPDEITLDPKYMKIQKQTNQIPYAGTSKKNINFR